MWQGALLDKRTTECSEARTHWIVDPSQARIGEQINALWENMDEACRQHHAATEAARGSEGEAARPQRRNAPAEQRRQHACARMKKAALLSDHGTASGRTVDLGLGLE